MRRVFTAIIGASVLFACVEPQVGTFAFRSNTTNQQKADSWLDCKVRATREVPVSTQVGTTPTYTTPVTVSPTYTNCYGYGNSASCTTTGGVVSGGQTYGGQAYSYDANSQLRRDYAIQCMRKKGYSLVDLPFCRPDQTPEGLTASMRDQIIKPTGNSCLVALENSLGVPVTVSN